MSDIPTKPAPSKPEPRLLSIRFAAAITVDGLTPMQGVTLGAQGWTADRIIVTQSTVWLHPPGAAQAIELARGSCVLRWDIAGLTLEEAVAMQRKGGR